MRKRSRRALFLFLMVWRFRNGVFGNNHWPDQAQLQLNRYGRRGLASCMQDRIVRRRGQFDRIWRADQLLEFPRLHLLPASKFDRQGDPDHTVELLQRLGPESNPRVGGSEFDLGLADGPDPL